MMQGIQRNRSRLLLGVLLSGVAGAAGAQQPSQGQASAIRQSCRGDYQTYCAGVPTGGSASLQCLQSHMANLSPACQTAVGAVAGGGTQQQQPPAQAHQAMPPAAGAPPPASSPPMSMRQQAALMRRSCGGDFRAYCQGVEPGGGRGLRCLAQNEARLSPPCKNALAEMQNAR